MRRISALIYASLIAGALIGGSASASAQETFFSEAVDVVDRSPAELQRAAGEALTRVFVRVSGNEEVLDQPAFAQAVRRAQEHVLLYSYREEAAQMQVFFEFDDAFIRDVFRDESVLYWEQRRPPVVVWLAVDDPTSRRFAASLQDSDLLAPALPLFADRGVDLRFPLLDLTDSLALPLETIWQRDFDAVRRASQRYGSEHSLVGRWIDLSDGTVLADWYYVGPERVTRLQLRDAEPAAIWVEGVDLAVDTMRDSLAVVLQQLNTTEAIAVSVRGVVSYADYQAVSAVFRDLAALVDLRIDSVVGDTLNYRIVGISSAAQMARLIPPEAGFKTESTLDRGVLSLIWESVQ